MKALLVLNDPPYGTERSYNGLRLAMALQKEQPAPEVTVFLMGDAVACAKRKQKTPNGYYNLERMVQAVARKGAVLLCSSCMDARGLADEEMVEGCRRSSMDELARQSVASDRVLVF